MSGCNRGITCNESCCDIKPCLYHSTTETLSSHIYLWCWCVCWSRKSLRCTDQKKKRNNQDAQRADHIHNIRIYYHELLQIKTNICLKYHFIACRNMNICIYIEIPTFRAFYSFLLSYH